MQNVLESAKTANVNLYPVSFRQILDDLAKDLDNPKIARMVRLFNVIGVSASFGMLGVSSEKVVSAIESVFAAKPALAKQN